MTAQIRNPYWAIILIPLGVFLILMELSIDPDAISITGRVVVFMALCYIGVRYVGRAPSLVWKADLSAAARNIVGFAMMICALLFQQFYGILYLAYDRPEWLSSLYWSSSFVILMAVGLALVMSSVPRFWPFGGPPSGLGVGPSIFMALIGALLLNVAEHLPIVARMVGALFGALTRAF